MPEPRWTPEAEAEVARAPFFIRPLARRSVLKAAREAGVTEIDVAFVNRVRAVSRERRAGKGA